MPRQPADELGPRARRTVAKLIAAARDVYLMRGYSGTTVDEITRVAGASRASFYTYFPAKRDVLLAVGETAASESLAVVEQLAELGRDRAELSAWVGRYFDCLDIHGSFAIAWTQAARSDEDVRVPGMRRHLGLCGRLGELLAATAGRTLAEPMRFGLVVSATIERSWDYQHLYGDTVARRDVVDDVANALWAMAREA